MKRLREKIHDRTDRRSAGTDIGLVIDELNPILRGWGNYFRTGNAHTKLLRAWEPKPAAVLEAPATSGAHPTDAGHGSR